MFRSSRSTPPDSPGPRARPINDLRSLPRRAYNNRRIGLQTHRYRPTAATGLPTPHAMTFASTRTLLAATIIGLSVAMGACALRPGEQFDALAVRHGMASSVIQGTQFKHRIVRKPGAPDPTRLHVYLAGDGSPWRHRQRVAADPTAREPIALKLMLNHPGAAFYLGRPCYHQVDTAPPCDSGYWTNARYSGTVVESMAAALAQLRREYGSSSAVTLYGYSGGGALAMLLAQRVEAVDRVVTVAANLDTDAWTRLHDYSPLTASLNPALQGPLPHRVEQLHLAGDNDDTVPATLITRALQRQSGATFAIVNGFDHHCCWETIWPAVVRAARHPQDACRQLQQASALTHCSRVNGSD